MKDTISKYWALARETAYAVAGWPTWKRPTMTDDKAFRTLIRYFDASDAAFTQMLSLAPEAIGVRIPEILQQHFELTAEEYEAWVQGEDLPEDAPARFEIAHFLRRHLEWNDFAAKIQEQYHTNPEVHAIIMEMLSTTPDRDLGKVTADIIAALCERSAQITAAHADLMYHISSVALLSGATE